MASGDTTTRSGEQGLRGTTGCLDTTHTTVLCATGDQCLGQQDVAGTNMSAPIFALGHGGVEVTLQFTVAQQLEGQNMSVCYHSGGMRGLGLPCVLHVVSGRGGLATADCSSSLWSLVQYLWVHCARTLHLMCRPLRAPSAVKLWQPLCTHSRPSTVAV